MNIKLKTAVMPLVIVNVVLFILQVLLGRNFTNAFMLIGSDVFARPWIMVTSMFLHANVVHLLFNMYVLLMFGSLIEQRIGQKRFFFIYFLSGIVASFISSFFYPRALGASGAIMGVLGVVIMLMPNLRVLFFFIVPMPLWIAAIIIALMDVFGIIVPTGIGNIAHLVGMGCGLLYGVYLKNQRRNFDRKFSSGTHMNLEDVREYLRTGRI